MTPYGTSHSYGWMFGLWREHIAGVRPSAPKVRLNVREQQIVDHLLLARTNREIADSLTISEKTVKRYMTTLMQKLNARNRVEVAIQAQRSLT